MYGFTGVGWAADAASRRLRLVCGAGPVLTKKCVLLAIGCQEMKHLPAEERDMRREIQADAEILCVLRCVYRYIVCIL